VVYNQSALLLVERLTKQEAILPARLINSLEQLFLFIDEDLVKPLMNCKPEEFEAKLKEVLAIYGNLRGALGLITWSVYQKNIERLRELYLNSYDTIRTYLQKVGDKIGEEYSIAFLSSLDALYELVLSLLSKIIQGKQKELGNLLQVELGEAAIGFQLSENFIRLYLHSTILDLGLWAAYSIANAEELNDIEIKNCRKLSNIMEEHAAELYHECVKSGISDGFTLERHIGRVREDVRRILSSL